MMMMLLLMMILMMVIVDCHIIVVSLRGHSFCSWGMSRNWAIIIRFYVASRRHFVVIVVVGTMDIR